MLELFIELIDGKHIIMLYNEVTSDYDEVDYSNFFDLQQCKGFNIIIDEIFNTFIFEDYTNMEKFKSLLPILDVEHFQIHNLWNIRHTNDVDGLPFDNEQIYKNMMVSFPMVILKQEKKLKCVMRK